MSKTEKLVHICETVLQDGIDWNLEYDKERKEACLKISIPWDGWHEVFYAGEEDKLLKSCIAIANEKIQIGERTIKEYQEFKEKYQNLMLRCKVQIPWTTTE